MWLRMPAVADPMQTEPSRVDKQRRKPPHPPVHGDVVDLDATLGQQLLHIPVGQPEPQVPPHRQHDHVRREANPANAEPAGTGCTVGRVGGMRPKHAEEPVSVNATKSRALLPADFRPARLSRSVQVQHR